MCSTLVETGKEWREMKIALCQFEIAFEKKEEKLIASGNISGWNEKRD